MPADETNDTGLPPAASRRAPDPARYTQGPRGTRDFYPLEMAKRRWIEERWRRVAVRFGFEEIDGPRFEHLDTYTVKSGEGIINELFSFTRAGGETEFALRPEFTPTLARMVASKANALPKPIKWFSVGPYFRAERPQRGRLREFLQWNVDMVGDPSPEADAEIIACCVEFLRECGLDHEDVQIGIANRNITEHRLVSAGVARDRIPQAFALLDQREKVPFAEFQSRAQQIGLDLQRFAFDDPAITFGSITAGYSDQDIRNRSIFDCMVLTHQSLVNHGVQGWYHYNDSIVRGLAYYTGTVFEVHEATGAERAIAGGGRYDNLVELFGGPSTPAVGFAMGDVVLSLVLQDKGLMLSDAEIAKELRLDPDVFVFSVDASLDAHAAGLLARCRSEGMHARRSYKTTRNVGKLLKDASSQRARFAAFVEPSDDGSGVRVQVKDLQGGGGQESFASVDDAVAFLTRVE